MSDYKAPVIAVIGIVFLFVIIQIGLSIYTPFAMKNAIKQTTGTNAVYDGVTVNTTGNGQTTAQATQEVQDNITMARWISGIFLGLVLLFVILMSAWGMMKKHG